jgi:tetratricopeptide (TPR) repeat protein
MEEIRTENAITRRLDGLQKLWNTFRQTPTARCCCWVVPQDALNMIDTFYQVNAHESSNTPDIFLRFESPFINAKSYGKALSEELEAFAQDESLTQDDSLLNWQSKHIEDKNNVAVGFLRNFFHFSDSLAISGRVVAFISPNAIANAAAWEQWWTEALSLNLPDKINFMLCDTEGSEILQKVAQKYPNKFTVIRPELKMDDAIRELMCEYADQEDNCTHFRKAFFELTQTIPTKDVSAINEASKKAFNLARLIGYPHLEVAVLCTAATGFSTAGKLQMAIKAYDEAAKIAKAAEDKPIIAELPEAKLDLADGNIFKQLGMQVLFFKASAYLSAAPPQYELAFSVYEQAETLLTQMIMEKATPEQEADSTNGGSAHFHRLEAIRMMGYCAERMGRNQLAFTTYTKAIGIAERMSEEMRQSTLLAFVGQAVLKICQKKGLKEEFWIITDKMNVLLGKGWEESLPKAA